MPPMLTPDMESISQSASRSVSLQSNYSEKRRLHAKSKIVGEGARKGAVGSLHSDVVRGGCDEQLHFQRAFS